MNNNQIEKMAFIGGSMLCLAEETDRTLCHLTELVGIDALEEMLDHAGGLRYAIGPEDMSQEIRYYCDMECSLLLPHRDNSELEEIGTAIAELVADLEPTEGTEANALFAVLRSQTVAELVEGGLGRPERTEIKEAYLAEMAERRKEVPKHDIV